MTPDPATPPTLGAIIAGGRARRIGGGDKGFHLVGGRPVLGRVIERLAPQVERLVLNANGNPARFDDFRLPVVADGLAGYPGPLAGILAVLEWAAAAEPATGWLVTVPGDAPFVPRDLVRRLHDGSYRDDRPVACAASGGRTHPVVALWRVSLAASLRRALVEDGLRKVDAFRLRFPCSVMEWATDPADPFFNINTAQDLAEADRLAAVYPSL